MKSKTIWIQQALIQLGILLVAGTAIFILGLIMQKEHLMGSALFFMSGYGLIMGPALDPFVFRNPVALAVSMGETRKGIYRGLEMTRVIYMGGVMALFLLNIILINPYPDVYPWSILIGFLGTLLVVSALAAIVSAFTYQRGSNNMGLRLLEGIISAFQLIFFLRTCDSLLICTAVLVEGIILTFISVSLEKRVFYQWNFRA